MDLLVDFIDDDLLDFTEGVLDGAVLLGFMEGAVVGVIEYLLDIIEGVLGEGTKNDFSGIMGEILSSGVSGVLGVSICKGSGGVGF